MSHLFKKNLSGLNFKSFNASFIFSILKRLRNSSIFVSIEKHFDIGIFQFDRIILLAALKAKPSVFLSCLVLSYLALWPNRHTYGKGTIFTSTITEINPQTSVHKNLTFGAKPQHMNQTSHLTRFMSTKVQSAWV